MVMEQADLYEAKCYFRSLRYSKAANLADSGDVHRIWKHIPNVFLNCNICKTVAQLVEQEQSYSVSSVQVRPVALLTQIGFD